MSVNATMLLDRLLALEAALEARDGDSLVTVKDCGPGFPDYGENATGPEGLNMCVMVHSTVWFWLGGSCMLGHVALSVPYAFAAYVIDTAGGDETVLDTAFETVFANEVIRFTIWFGASTLLLGGYQRDFHVAGFVLVGLSLLLLVILVLDEFNMLDQIRKFREAKESAAAAVSRKAESSAGGPNEDADRTVDAKNVDADPASVVPESGDTQEITAKNVYSDPDKPLFTVLVYAAAQLILVGFYVYSLYMNGRPDFTNTDTYMFYFAGCLFQYILASKHQGVDTSMLDKIREERVFKDGEQVKMGAWNIFIRKVLDITVNLGAASVIYGSIPLQLAGTSTTPYDFMLNSCATVFILELDDKESDIKYLLKPKELNSEEKAASTEISRQESAAKCESSAMASSNADRARAHVISATRRVGVVQKFGPFYLKR